MLYYLRHLSHKRLLEIQISDSRGNEKYRVIEKYGVFLKKAYMTDAKNNVVAVINAKMGITPRCEIVLPNNQKIQMKQTFSLVPHYKLSGTGYEVRGRIYSVDYGIFNGSTELVNIQKEYENGHIIQRCDLKAIEAEIDVFAIIAAIESCKRTLFVASVRS